MNTEYKPLPPKVSGLDLILPNYKLLAPDHVVISANDYELTTA